MKIKQLAFSNINNLKGGPHQISFDEEPLRSAGIFAIVGPTGAGKSTILDVITLALFNRVPRLPSISDRRIEKDGSIITHFAKNAEASITYEVDGRLYTSKWSIRIASSGKVQPYHMELLDESGSIISEKSAVPGKNESIIGLNYDQFVKSIILSQGDFSRFLKAKKDERSELLEKLTGSHVYRKIGKAAFIKHKEVQQALINQKSLIAEINVLSDEALQALQEEKDKTLKIALTLEDRIKRNNITRNQKLSIKALQEKIAIKQEEFEILKQAIQDFKNDDHRLEKHDKTSLFVGDLKLYEKAGQNIIQTSSALESYKVEIRKAQSDLALSLSGLAKLTSEEVNQKNFREVMDDYESEVNALENQLKNLKEKGRETRTRISQIVDYSHWDIDPKSKTESAISQLMQDEELQLLKVGNSEEDINKLKLTLKTLTDDWNTLKTLALVQKNLSDYIDDGANQRQRLMRYRSLLNQNKVVIDKQKTIVLAIKEKSELLIKQKEDSLKIAKLEDLRSQLQEGDPCPLCGSLDHPFEKHLDTSPIKKIEEEIAKNEESLSENEAILRKLAAAESEASAGISISTKHLKELELKIDVLKDKIDLEKRNYTGDLEDLNSDIPTLAKGLETKVKSVAESIEAREKLTVIRNLLKEFTQLSEIGRAYAETKSKKLSLYTGNDVKADCNMLQDKFVSATTRLEKSGSLIEDKEKDLVEYKQELEKLRIKLQEVVAKLGLHSIEEMSALIIEEDEYLALSRKKKMLNESHISIKAELEQMEKNEKESAKADSIPETSLEELISLISAEEIKRNSLNAKVGELASQLKFDADKRISLRSKQKLIEQLNAESDKWSLLNRMIGSANGDKFANFAQDLTLKNLLVFTNIRLRDLTDRYLLDMPGEGGTLTVVDRYQGDTERSVTTLSGGEIFILSLALAISLSDMASQNIALESLFIDEGFGTLDQETLDVAMSTLEKLQSENRKMVGVISHVEALKERIHVQIQLNKNAQGYSKIKVVG